jgi:hypothetical protein
MPKPVGATPADPRSGSATASWIFGGLLLAVLVFVLFCVPEPTPFQRYITQFIMGLLAGFFAYFFMGGVVLKGTLAGQVVGASGGFALFILVAFVVTPFDIKTSIADVAPGLLPADDTVVEAQRTLAQNGFYTGPITGKADSQTREAIKKFQVSKNMKVDGFVRNAPRSILGVKTPRQPPTPP